MTVDIAALITVIEKTLKNVRNEQWEYRKLNGEHQVIVKGSLKTGAGWRQYSHITNEVDDIREAKYIAAVNPENINTLITELEAAQARIAELESKQEPVALKLPKCLEFMTGDKSVYRESVSLYTTPPKPVIKLPEPELVYSTATDSYGEEGCLMLAVADVLRVLNEHGIVVKDGEQ